MTADQSLDSASWFKPGTYSVWVEEPYPEDDHKPALLVLYEWEIEGLRGLFLVEAWGALSALDPQRAPVPENRHQRRNWCGPYISLYEDSQGNPEILHSLGLAKAIRDGDIKRVGEMPKLPDFTDPPLAIGHQPTQPPDKPVDSHP